MTIPYSDNRFSPVFDSDDISQEAELKLLELKASGVVVRNPLAFKGAIKRNVRRTLANYQRVRYKHSMSLDAYLDMRNGDDEATQSLPVALIDDRDVRRIAAWCVLVDLPTYIIRIGLKRVRGDSLTREEQDQLTYFRKQAAMGVIPKRKPRLAKVAKLLAEEDVLAEAA